MAGKDQPIRPSKPDISPDERWRIQMKTMIFAALTVLSLAACSGPTLSGQSDTAPFPGAPHVVTPTGPYDNTANSLGGRPAGNYGGGG
jgi:hypothetical protein